MLTQLIGLPIVCSTAVLVLSFLDVRPIVMAIALAITFEMMLVFS